MDLENTYQKAYQFYQVGEYQKSIQLYQDLMTKIKEEGIFFQLYYNIAVCYKDWGLKLLIAATETESSYINDENFPESDNKKEICSYLNKGLSMFDSLIKNITGNKKYDDLYKQIIINHTDICLLITKMVNDNNDSYIYRALSYDIENYILYYNLGIINRNKENFYQAICSFKQSLIYNPQYSMSYTDLSLLYRTLGDNLSAKQILEKGLIVLPKDYDIMNNLAIIYMDMKDLKNSKELFLKIIDFLETQKPTDYKAILNRVFVNIGCLYNKMGNPRLGIDYFDKSLSINFHILAFQNKLLDINYLDDQKSSLEYIKQCPEVFQRILKIEGIKVSEELNRKGNKNNKKINIAYVSGDFKEHAVVFFIQSLLTLFDKNKFQVYAISTNSLNDQTIKSYSDVQFIKAKHMKTKEIYQLIQQLEIDVLVDLAGHTMYNKLTLFKARSAPVQLTYIGYPNTTGLLEMDYKIVDLISDPEQSTQFYTEKLIRFPRMFLDYTAPDYLPDIVRNQSDKIIFGSMNRLAKISHQVLLAWREILKRVPNSLIYIKDRIIFEPEFINHQDLAIVNFFTDEEKKRLVFFNYCFSHQEHLAWLNNIHISLDTWPYSFTTGGMESLSMGVPIITKNTPNVHASNVCSSILYHCEMKDWIAYSEEEYIELAVKKAEEIRTNGLNKDQIRQKFLSSCICNHQEFIELYEKTITELVEKQINN